jgi:hypothetical protein
MRSDCAFITLSIRSQKNHNYGGVYMKILVDLTHPAHVHFFKHAIWTWQRHGNEVIITARDKDITVDLLDCYGFAYTNLGGAKQGVLGLGWELLTRELKLYGVVRRTRPDIIVAINGAFSAHVGKLMGIPVIVFVDTEHAKLSHRISFPFVTSINTPICFREDLGQKQFRYEGYHELAYTHPDWFTPNSEILDELGLQQDEKLFVIRFVSWKAAHDIGQSGISLEGKRELVRQLSNLGRVIITSESPLPSEFELYRMRVSPTKIHDLLAFSSLYIGEGGTMASEAAILGTPSIFVSTLTAGTFQELEKVYKLMFTTSDENKAIEQAIEWAQAPDIKQEWHAKRQRILADKIDVTAWMVDFVEWYPESLCEYQEKH